MTRRDFCSLAAAGAPLAVQTAANPDPGAPKATIERWKDLRFGMFVHWGPVSIVATEIGWSRGGERGGRQDKTTGNVPVEVYDNLYRMFNPTRFDPDEWVRRRTPRALPRWWRSSVVACR
jgi:alpha-L-fucosidase